ncbi:MAG TPA: MBL fold metallo-hydrolase, partial [Candidatus Dormibacteraeota bacterium]|nr:MBL fold metallo-hydrolase [Candidatus Dormibacteraeota bacterium]
FPPVHVDEVVEPGETLDVAGGIRVLDAPGHAPGHLAFHFLAAEVLCVGDAAEAGDHGLRPPPARHCADAVAAAETAGRLAAISVRCVAPGHGLPIVDGRGPRREPRT